MLAQVFKKLNFQVELAGLDIGSESVKLIRLLKNAGGYTAVAAAREVLEPADTPAAVTAAVKRCFEKTGLSRWDAVCGIEGSQVVVRGFKFPPLPAAAIEQAVAFEAQQVCPFDSQHSVLDYQLIDIGDLSDDEKDAKAVRRHGLMVMSTDEAVREKKTILEQAGARAIMVDATALATLNCLTELDLLQTQGSVAVIDIGAAYSHVVIYGQDGLPFVRDLTMAGRTIIRSISEEVDLGEDQVRQVLSGAATPTETKNKVLLALNNAIRPLATAINETLRFYSFQEKCVGVETVYLCGGFSLVPTFVEFLTDALSVEVQVLNPFAHMTCDAGDDTEWLNRSGPAWVAAVGLAMRTI